jgi:hypothetical protein
MELGEKVDLSKSSISPFNEAVTNIGVGKVSIWSFIMNNTFYAIKNILDGINNIKI